MKFRKPPPLAIILATLLGLGLYHGVQAQVERYSTTAASNNAAPPNGAPESMAASAVNDTMREMMAQTRRFAEQSVSAQFGIAGGTADAILVTPAITWPTTGYISGQVIRFRTTGPNTVAAPTIKVSGMTTTATIAKISNTSLSAGDMPSGSLVQMIYDGSVSGFILSNANELVTISSVPLATTGVSGQVLATSGTVASYVSASILDIAPRGFIGGYRITPASLTTMTISPGHVTDDRGILGIVLSNAMTKAISGTWTVGNNLGGLDTGTVENNQWYHVFAIKNNGSGIRDILFTKTITNVTLPSGYQFKRRIGSFRTDGSAQIIPVTQNGGDFTYVTPPALDVDVTNPGTSAVTRTVNVPLGVKVKARFVAQTSQTATTHAVYFSELESIDSAASETASPLGQLNANTTSAANTKNQTVEIWTNTAGQIRSRFSGSGAGDVLRIQTYGWYDERGQND